VNSGNVQKRIENAGGTAALGVAGKGRTLATIGEGGIIVVDIEVGRIKKRLIETKQPSITGLSFSVDGKRIVITGYDRWSVLDVASGDVVIGMMEQGPSLMLNATFTSDGTEVAVIGDRSDAIRYYNIDSGKLARTAPWIDGFRELSFSGNHKVMVSCGHSESGIIVWDLSLAARLKTFGQPRDYEHVSISYDGTTIAGARLGSNGFDGIDTWHITDNELKSSEDASQ
jgi:WD40 repeat protein